MPLPNPGDSESQSEFISRCMGNAQAQEDFPDQEQRAGVCHSIWRNRDKEGKMEIKHGSLKKLTEDGEGIAVISTLNVIDSDNDVVVPGAFGKQVSPMVPAHDWHEAPIGKASISEVGDEALAHFKMNLKTEGGREWHEALKFDFDNPPAKQEYSYGFSILDGGADHGEFNGQQVRFLKKLKVHEVSPVLLGAGVATRTLAIKTIKARMEITDVMNNIAVVQTDLEKCLKFMQDQDPGTIDLKSLEVKFKALQDLMTEFECIVKRPALEERGRQLVGRFAAFRKRVLDRSIGSVLP